MPDAGPPNLNLHFPWERIDILLGSATLKNSFADSSADVWLPVLPAANHIRIAEVFSRPLLNSTRMNLPREQFILYNSINM